MNKDQFLRYLKEPTSLSTAELVELEKIIDDYPYFQSARALMARGKKHLSPQTAPKYISSAAVYVTDRALFKKYVNGQLLFLQSRPSESSEGSKQEKTVKSPAPTVPKKSIAAPDKEKVHKKPETPVKREEPAAQVDQILQDSPSTVQLDELIKEVYQDLEDLKQSKARFREWERKQEEEEAVDSAVQQAIGKQKKPKGQPQKSDEEEAIPPSSEVTGTKTTKAPKPDTTKKVDVVDEKEKEKAKVDITVKEPPSSKQKATPKKKTSKGIPKAPKGSAGKDKTAKSTPKKTTPTKSSTTRKSSTKATKTDTKAKTQSKSGSVSAKKEKKIDDPSVKTKAGSSSKKKIETKGADDKKEGAGEVISKRSRGDRKQEESTIKGPEDQKKIISEFIDKDPGMARPGKEGVEDKENSDLSEKSTRFHADIASEYLAEIYIEQGKYNRAIEIYENLSLKFPEKKSFFASRIGQLKKK